MCVGPCTPREDLIGFSVGQVSLLEEHPGSHRVVENYGHQLLVIVYRYRAVLVEQ